MKLSPTFVYPSQVRSRAASCQVPPAHTAMRRSSALKPRGVSLARQVGPPASKQEVHRVPDQVLDEFTAEHEVETGIGVGISVPLGVEHVDFAREIGLTRNAKGLPFVSGNGTVKGSEYVTITQHPVEGNYIVA